MGLGHETFIRRDFPEDYVEQGGLARPVGADQPDPFSRPDGKRDAFEKLSVSDIFGHILNSEH